MDTTDRLVVLALILLCSVISMVFSIGLVNDHLDRVLVDSGVMTITTDAYGNKNRVIHKMKREE